MSQLQHTFKDGRVVDALVQMTNFTVGIDSKFPLPSFERIVASTSDEERPKLRRQLARDVVGHVDKIASAYLQPMEGTLDFALMYIACTVCRSKNKPPRSARTCGSSTAPSRSSFVAGTPSAPTSATPARSTTTAKNV
jgi:hypothetical protein